jgi:hypothetical protein
MDQYGSLMIVSDDTAVILLRHPVAGATTGQEIVDHALSVFTPQLEPSVDSWRVAEVIAGGWRKRMAARALAKRVGAAHKFYSAAMILVRA